MSHYPSGGTHSNSIVRDVLSDYGSCSDQCVLSDRHAWGYRGCCPDGRVTLHQGFEKFQFSMRSRMFFICERLVVCVANVILIADGFRYGDEWFSLAFVFPL